MKKKIVSLFALTLCICLLFTGCGESITALISGENDTIEYKIEAGEATVVSVPNKSTVTSIIIPDEYEGVPVTKIADYSAFNLEYVTEIYIGKNVNEIGNWSMTNNQHLNAFYVDEANENFCSVDGVLYTKDMKTVVYCPNTKEGEYEIADGVETVRSKAFYKCTKLTNVVFPETVISIEEKAFFRCSLEELTLPGNLEFIGKDAFAYCSNIKTVTIPKTIKQIDEYAFYNCTSLLEVNVMTAESNIKLGEKWEPTNNGIAISELKVNYVK